MNINFTADTSVLNQELFDLKKSSVDTEPQTTPEPKYRPLARLCAFFIFTSLSVTISVLTVCLTSQNTANKTCQLTFQRSATREIGYNSRPHHIAVGHFNKDHYLDIVVANSGTDSIGILLNRGNGTFNNQIQYSTGLQSRPYSLAVGHFNNDTLFDIVVANYGNNNIGVFLAIGNGNFSNQIITSLASSHPLSLAIGDFNKDNQMDIAVANYGTSTITLLFGNNDGTFEIQATYDMGYDSVPYSLVINDFNNDTQLDIAIVNYGTSDLVILLADGNGSFVNKRYSTGSGSHPCSIAIGDLNNDNTLDIAVANSDTENIGIFLGQGNGTFTNVMAYSTGFNSQPKFITISDIDNDNNLNIIVVDSGNDYVAIMQQNEMGNFTIITTHSTGFNSDPSSTVVADFDNDNKLDIAVTNNGTNNILVLTGYTSYPFTNQKEYSTGLNSQPNFVGVGDFNNDNYSDIVVTNSGSDNVGLFINLGNGTFRSQIQIPIEQGSELYCLAVADINKDNQLDIITVMKSINKIGILLGRGNGTFTYGESCSTGEDSGPESIAVGYLNHDTNLDIVVANYKSLTLCMLFGYGDGTFTNITACLDLEIFVPSIVLVNDINNDNISDIILSAYNNIGIAIMLQHSNGSFGDPLQVWSDGDDILSMAVGDLNNDHLLDIVYVSPSFSNLGLLFGYGNGTFTNVIKYSTGMGSWPLSVTLGYFNNDNLLDIAIANALGNNMGIFFGLGNQSFAPQITFSTGFGSLPCSIASADFNDDLQQDIVVTNQLFNNIAVFLLDYELDFAFETSYSTGSGPHPYSVAIGDLNKNNQSDIVVANSGNDNIQLLIDYNKGSFIIEIIYSTGFSSDPQFVTIADFNRDNQLDIAVANYGTGDISIYCGYDNETFDKPIIYSTSFDSSPSSIAVGDLNKDNWTDLVVSNIGSDDISVFLGFDYPTFTNNTIYIDVPFSTPANIAVGDFNNDHLYDMIVTDFGASNIHLYLAYGNGTFAERRSFSTGDYQPLSIAVGDFNRDNQLDVVVTHSGRNSIGIFISYGNGSFTSQNIYSADNSSNPSSVVVGDVNRDNILDLVVAYSNSSNIVVFIGDGNGSFTDQISYSLPSQSSPRSVAVANLNHDNFLDIAVANSGQNNIVILIGYGNGTFKDMTTLFTGRNSVPWSIAIGDINNDTWMDIVVANQNSKNVGIFFGQANDTFLSQTTYSTGSQSLLSSIRIADLNNDSKLDIIVSDQGNDNGNVGVFYGYSDGNFTVLKRYWTGWESTPLSIGICDFNNDSRLDFVVTYQTKAAIGVMLRLESEPFATAITFSTGDYSDPKSVAIGDFNSDNHLDIVVANSGTNNIGILLGNGDGTFDEQDIYSTGDNSQPVSIALGDFNNDSRLDIVVANAKANTIIIFCGDGNGSVAILRSYSTGISSAPSSIAVKDLNKDSYLDIVVSNYGSNDVLVFYGSNNGTFLDRNSYSVGYNAHPQSVGIGDINSDGLLDIIVANYGTDYVEILLQTC